ncbi:MAG: MaoC family dehydratase [Ktedonobacteraceae bacterium]
MATRYFEDFQVGDIIDLGSTSASADEIIAFARQFDPQPFHIDPEQAKHSAFGTLVASGWHSSALFMRLLVDGLLNDTISMGSPGVDEVRWRKPVHPDEKLYGRLTVIESTVSKSRPNMGIIRSVGELVNQEGEVVMSLKGLHFFGRRPETSQSR